MKQGIYIWRNKITNRVLVGQTQNFKSRKAHYLTALRKGTYRNKHFQRSWNKYGEESFEFIVIQEVLDATFLTSYEQKYLDYYRSLCGTTYNQVGPVDNPRRGLKASHETRQKQSESMKRFHQTIGHSEEALAKMSVSRTGKQHTKRHPPCPEHVKEIISKLHTGKQISEETRAKLVLANLGRKHTEETKAKMRAAKQKKFLTQDLTNDGSQ